MKPILVVTYQHLIKEADGATFNVVGLSAACTALGMFSDPEAIQLIQRSQRLAFIDGAQPRSALPLSLEIDISYLPHHMLVGVLNTGTADVAVQVASEIRRRYPNSHSQLSNGDCCITIRCGGESILYIYTMQTGEIANSEVHLTAGFDLSFC